ncbi:MAG: hypothetical protein WDA53_03695 [Bacillota bacterium]
MKRKELLKELKTKDLVEEKIGSGFMVTVEGQPFLKDTARQGHKKDLTLRRKG